MTHLHYLCYRLKEIFKRPVHLFKQNPDLIDFCTLYLSPSQIRLSIERDSEGKLFYIFKGSILCFSPEHCEIQSGYLLKATEHAPGGFSHEESLSETDIRGIPVLSLHLSFSDFRIPEKDFIESQMMISEMDHEKGGYDDQ